MRRHASLALRVFVAAALAAAAATAGALLAIRSGAGASTVAVIALAAGLAVAGVAARRAARPWTRLAPALADGVASFRDGDFSMRLAAQRDDALGDLVAVYNELGEVLASERTALRRRELLLHGALEASPAAVLLVGGEDRLIYANRAARVLFADGQRLEGRSFAELAAAAPPELAAALATEHEALATVALEEGEETFQISQRHFELDSRRQRLVQVRRLTAELRRQEVAGWKKAIRVVSHEVRSSLAPIRSLARSAQTLAERGDGARVAELLDDIDHSAAGLQRFIEGYGRFARLPEPRREPVALAAFLEHLRRLEPFELDGAAPAVVLEIDPGQIQQVLVNLLRNAREAGSPPGEISIAASTDGAAATIEVRDRGCGMDAEALERALLPFHSTKPEGAGLGLALCREILEAHGGALRLSPRPGGGLVAACRIPLEAPDR
ncbi:MAG: hypothetical protein AMXMBFR36_15570 [Acidobacteriota bacterium]